MDQQDFFTQLCCINCQTISESPLMSTCCNSVICSDCKALVMTKSCQKCSQKVFQLVNNPFLNKMSSQIKLPCKYGCGFTESLKLVKSHESNCGLKKYECTLCNFKSQGDEFLCHLNVEHSAEVMLTFSKGGKQEQPAMNLDPNVVQFNRNNFPTRPGTTGKYYCSQDIGFQCGCCRGCGPTNGDNCLPCMILDVKSRNLPKGYLVNKYGASAILKDNVFSCGRLFDNRKRCGENRFWCDGCDSLTRNARHYYDAFAK